MDATPRKELSLFDSTCIIVGIIVGAGMYEMAPEIAGAMGSASGTMLIWLAGGLLALTGALCYAELATAYPRQGGDYVYQTRAYGRWAGFLFGWSQLAIVRPGDIALMAFVFGTYARTLYEPFAGCKVLYAAGAVVLLTAVNILGVREGKWTQNVLTVVKAAGLLAIVCAALFAPAPAAEPAPQGGPSSDSVKLALLFVLFAYGGWNEMAYVAAEVKNPARNIVRALVIGTVGVTVLYLLANTAFLGTLGYKGMTASKAVATDAVATVFPDAAGRAVGVLICISALGAANGLIFTGARISYALGTEHACFRPLGRWHARLGTPVWSLLAQGGLSLAIVLLARSFINTIIYSAPVVWLFFLATGLSVFVLRAIDPETPRPYRVTGYPVTPALFCACSGFMLYGTASYAWAWKPEALAVCTGVLLTGALGYGIAALIARHRASGRS